MLGTRAPVPLPMLAAPLAERERADARRNRERILCAARRLIMESGLEHLSMDDVAAAAGVGKGTLYRRFGDRSSLLRALIEPPERRFQDELIRGAPPLGPGAGAPERLHAFGAAYLAFLEEHAPLLEAAEHVTRIEPYAHPVYGLYRTHVLVLLREALGEEPALGYMADALMAPLSAAGFLHQRRVRGMSLEELQAGWCRLVDAVLAAWPATGRPDPLSRAWSGRRSRSAPVR